MGHIWAFLSTLILYWTEPRYLGLICPYSFFDLTDVNWEDFFSFLFFFLVLFFCCCIKRCFRWADFWVTHTWQKYSQLKGLINIEINSEFQECVIACRIKFLVVFALFAILGMNETKKFERVLMLLAGLAPLGWRWPNPVRTPAAATSSPTAWSSANALRDTPAFLVRSDVFFRYSGLSCLVWWVFRYSGLSCQVWWVFRYSGHFCLVWWVFRYSGLSCPVWRSFS